LFFSLDVANKLKSNFTYNNLRTSGTFMPQNESEKKAIKYIE